MPLAAQDRGSGRQAALRKKIFGAAGTSFRVGHYRFVTAETPPPVQAAGDTIPKGLRASGAEAFFFAHANGFEGRAEGAAQLFVARSLANSPRFSSPDSAATRSAGS